jgi:hypothetical protein
MPKRQFRDADGIYWDVWDVHPTDLVWRYDRRSSSRADAVEPESNGRVGPSLDPALEDGWLCFQAGLTRRRFAPIPPAWFDLPDGVLRVMLDIAIPVRANTELPGSVVARPEATS